MKRKTSLVVALGTCLVLLLAALPFMGACAEEAAPAPAAPAPATPVPAPAGPQTITPTVPAAPAPAAPAKPEKVYELAFADYQPPVLAQAQWIDRWAKKMEEESNGRLKIRVYHSQSLLPAAGSWDGVMKGIADMATSFRWETHGTVFDDYINHFMSGVDSGDMGKKVFDDCYEKFPELREEWSGNKLFYIASPPPYCLHNSVRPLHTPEDLVGLQIRVSGPTNADLIELWGGTPVFATIADAYELLQKGTAQGIHCGIDALKLFRFGELLKYTTWTFETSPVGYFHCMNWDTWNSLPPDLQDIIERSIPQAEEEMQIIMDEEGQKAIDWCKEATPGYEFYTPTPEEYALWYAPLGPLRAKMAADIDAQGYPGTAVYEYAQERVKYYRAQKAAK
jgi:TRAP-type C4-dicarboxylate transport system substrate-binding protein